LELTVAMPLSIMFASVIVVTEQIRRRFGQVDFLLPVSLLMLLCFAVSPVMLPAYKADDLGSWNWVFEREINNWRNAVSILMAGVLYGVTVWVYTNSAMPSLIRHSPRLSNISDHRLITVAVLLLTVGLLAIGVFSGQRGGLIIAITQAAVFKTSEESLGSWAFAIKLSPVTTVASFIFLHLSGSRRTWCGRFLFLSLFTISLLVSLLGLFLLGGRVSLMFYLLTFVLGEMTYRRKRIRLIPAMLVFICIVLPIILFGKSALRVFMDEFDWAEVIEEFVEAPATIVRLLVLEFSFPWVNVANYLSLTPEQISFRWFLDVPLGIVYLLPKLLLGIEPPIPINVIYQEIIGAPVPTDMVSFGYVSAGLAGVLILGVIYGFALRCAETVFSDQSSRIACLIRAAWLLVLGSQVMYGSPYHFFLGTFPLIVGTSLLFLAAKKPRSDPA
jgi:hypothetical protein